MQFIREKYWEYEYEEVVTPNLFNFELWEHSGHADHYKENMFLVDIEEQQYGLKPMNCPGARLLQPLSQQIHAAMAACNEAPQLQILLCVVGVTWQIPAPCPFTSRTIKPAHVNFNIRAHVLRGPVRVHPYRRGTGACFSIYS